MVKWFTNVIRNARTMLRSISSAELVLESIEPDPKTGILKIFLRFNCKSTAPIKQDPYEFFLENSHRISKQLSKEDVKKVLNALLENQKIFLDKKYKKTFVLIKHLCSPETGTLSILYKDSETEQFYVRSAQDIFHNRELLKNFSSEDAACIGNLAVNEVHCYPVASNSEF